MDLGVLEDVPAVVDAPEIDDVPVAMDVAALVDAREVSDAGSDAGDADRGPCVSTVAPDEGGSGAGRARAARIFARSC